MKIPYINRSFLYKLGISTLLSGAAMATGSLMYATKVEPGWLEISSISLILPRLHPAFDNYRIVHISDIHMGTWMTPQRLTEAVKAVNMLHPDLIAITGDFVTDLHHTIFADLHKTLSKLKSKDGAFAILGNHDYWSNSKTIRQVLEISGINELPNTVHTLQRGDANLHIAGVDDYWENKARLRDVIKQIPDQGAAILLAHEPDFAVVSSKTSRFDLQLSGHTHGGQVNIPKIGPIVLPMYGRKYPAGLYQIDDMLLYTNRGLGTGRPQIRFNCRPEITMLNFTCSYDIIFTERIRSQRYDRHSVDKSCFSGYRPADFCFTFQPGALCPRFLFSYRTTFMLTAHQLCKSYKLNQILIDVSFNINAGERVGLIGPNGCGKTTLLRILNGEMRADSGHVSFTPSNLQVGYLTQGFEPGPNDTVKSLMQKATFDPEILETELVRVSTALADQPDNSDLQLAYDQILNRMQQPSAIGRLSSILAALGLDYIPDEQLAITLSGGQKTRLALAMVLLSEPQLLLLDEPTNHLDIAMLEWLEDWLNQFRGAALIVSHDRVFIEHTVTRILDLNPRTHTVKSYAGSYADYIETLTREHDIQMQSYNDQEAEIRRMKRDIARTRAQAERTEREASSIRIGGEKMKIKGYKDYQQGIAKKVARKAKSRQKKLDRYVDSDQRIEKPKAGWQIKLEFDNPDRLGRQVLTLKDLAVGYPGYTPLLRDVNLNVQAGQRIAFTGPNGSGKTTLLRTITGELPPYGGAYPLRCDGKIRLYVTGARKP